MQLIEFLRLLASPTQRDGAIASLVSDETFMMVLVISTFVGIAIVAVHVLPFKMRPCIAVPLAIIAYVWSPHLPGDVARFTHMLSGELWGAALVFMILSLGVDDIPWTWPLVVMLLVALPLLFGHQGFLTEAYRMGFREFSKLGLSAQAFRSFRPDFFVALLLMVLNLRKK